LPSSRRRSQFPCRALDTLWSNCHRQSDYFDSLRGAPPSSRRKPYRRTDRKGDFLALPERKHPRLKGYDYSQCGCYHITLCTKDRQPVLAQVIPAGNPYVRASIRLTACGETAKRYIENISGLYRGVALDKYVIMPNHVHLLLSFQEGAATSVPDVVRSLKRMVTRELGRSIWQVSYHDVIIRNDIMYQCEWTYIDQNPDKWAEDELYVP